MTEELREQAVVEQTTQDIPESETQPSETETEANEAQALEETNEEQAPKENAAWARLRVENKQLKEKVAQQDVSDDYLQELNQMAGASPYAYQEQQITPETDLTQVSTSLNQAQKMALEASQRVRNLEIQLEEQEMFAQYPHAKEDKLFQQLVAEKKLVSRFMGKERRYSDIAREVDAIIRKDRDQAAEQARQSEKQMQVEKMAATTQTPSYSSNGNTGDDRETLRMRARRGDQSAQVELTKRLLGDISF